MAIKILLLGLLAATLYLTWRRVKQGIVGRVVGAAWVVLWLTAAAVVAWPEIASRFAAAVGVGRGADAVVYLGLILIFYLIFRIFLRLDKIERDITAIVREEALKDLPREMPGNNESVSVVVVAWNHRCYLADCLRALENSVGKNLVRLILVDNASTDGTAEFVRSEIMDASGTATKGGMPAEFIASPENLGFAGANNLAIDKALARGDGFVYLLNPDTEAQPGFLEAALEVMRENSGVGIVQSLLLLHPGTGRINSWGNEIHFLGFGWSGGESVPADSEAARKRLAVRDIAYASGAGMLVRAECLKSVGGLDRELFAYHEDLEFSWRARLSGWRVMLAPGSVVRHKYEFSRSIGKWYLMERNRFLVTLWLYSLPTLVLLLPALVVTEIGLWVFAIKGGWWREKLRAYAYVLDPRRWPSILRTRLAKQSLREVGDREATALFSGVFSSSEITWPPMALGNIFLNAYWHLVRFFMIW